jgi:hypothetical protein
MYWRRYKISEIPIDNDEAFGRWLKNRWTEKDYLLEHFYRHGSFPAGCPIKAMQAEAAAAKELTNNGEQKNQVIVKPATKTAKFITTEVKAGGWEEFLAIFAPITAAATALSSGDLAPGNIDFDALLNKVAQQQQLNLLTVGKAAKAPKSTEEMRQALTQASRAAGGPPIAGSAVEKITRNAAKTQRELQEAMSKHPLPEASKTLTIGRTSRDTATTTASSSSSSSSSSSLSSQSKSTSSTTKPAPSVRKSLPMTPAETAITRPLTTLAMQRARQGVQKVAENKLKPRATAARTVMMPKVAATANKTAAKSATPLAANKTTKTPATATATVKKPVSQAAIKMTFRSTTATASTKAKKPVSS